MKTPQQIHELFKERELPRDFCIIPFINMIFNPNGDIGICRQKGSKHVVGSLEKNSIEEVWNNEYMQKWRDEFLTGNVCICKREIEEDFCNVGAGNYEYFDEVELKKIQKLPMQKFTANFNGKCNLECIMCDVWKEPNGYYDKSNFWEKAKTDFFPYIKEVELLSGEPFVQKDTWRLIDEISSVNPNCLWSFTTNAHWKLNNHIVSKLNKIKIKNIHLSVDSLDPTIYSKIRKKGNLHIVLENIKELKNYEIERLKLKQSDLGLAVHFLVMKENYMELPNVLSFISKRNLRVILDLLRMPETNSLLSFNETTRIDVLVKYFNLLTPEQLKLSVRIILPLIKSLKKTDQQLYLLRFNQEINAST